MILIIMYSIIMRTDSHVKTHCATRLERDAPKGHILCAMLKTMGVARTLVIWLRTNGVNANGPLQK